MGSVDESLAELWQKIKEREQRQPVSFREFLNLTEYNPDRIIRNIFQSFYDMVYSHIGRGIDEYPDDPESINYVYYDSSSLFETGADHPFFADRLFANRLINHIGTFRRGIRQNRIYIFEGPHGSGKSTFLNNLLMRFEQYARTEDGAMYETLWRLDKEALGVASDHKTYYIMEQLRSLVDTSAPKPPAVASEHSLDTMGKTFLEVPCPSHDHPLLMIPRAYRKDLLQELIKDKEFKHRLFSHKQYEWVFRDNPCTICMSLYQTLLDMLDSPAKVFDMIFARKYLFNRRLGQGISVFNPGDGIMKTNVITNEQLQHQLNDLLRDSNRVHYLYSRYANTNNGIYALMDIKAHNKERLANLHGIISEGLHKVEDIEENVNSLFLAVMNPEDRENIADTQSFSDRITNIRISYVLDYNTELKIYKNVFGNQIESRFLPRVLQNFARVIISSRLMTESDALHEWIGDTERYSLYCDRNLQLLKMDIYAGVIPSWLREADRKSFTAKRRRKVIAESEIEGEKGFTGRDSLRIFNQFYATYGKKGQPITMAMMCAFFEKHRDNLIRQIPEGFLAALTRHYDYSVLQEVKESLYYYNEERISKEIQNYLFAINFELGGKARSVYTGEELDITEEYLEGTELRILGAGADTMQRLAFRKDAQQQYASKTLTQEMYLEGKKLYETQLYHILHQRYVHNLKENVLDPFLKNDNFRSAIKDYATEAFKTYDKRIREDVDMLMQNLNRKYGYTQQGAREVCIYVVDTNLAETYAGHG